MTSTPDLEALLERLDSRRADELSRQGEENSAELAQEAADSAAAIRELKPWLEWSNLMQFANPSEANSHLDQQKAERDALRAELATAQRRLLDTQTSGQTRYMIEADQLRAELEAAKKVLLTAKQRLYQGTPPGWIDHGEDCTLGIEPFKCTCGLDDWIKSLDAALAREGP